MTAEDARHEIETAIAARKHLVESAKYEGLSADEREYLQRAIIGQDERVVAASRWL